MMMSAVNMWLRRWDPRKIHVKYPAGSNVLFALTYISYKRQKREYIPREQMKKLDVHTAPYLYMAVCIFCLAHTYGVCSAIR